MWVSLYEEENLKLYIVLDLISGRHKIINQNHFEKYYDVTVILKREKLRKNYTKNIVLKQIKVNCLCNCLTSFCFLSWSNVHYLLFIYPNKTADVLKIINSR